MSDLNAVRKKLPALAGLDDDQLVDALHTLYYPDIDKDELSKRLGYKPPEKPVEQAGLLRTAGDVGIKLAQGVVDLGQSAVGVGDLVTGGAVGNALGSIGYDPKGTNEILGEYLSDSQKAADAKVQNADGFMDSIVASVQNPRSILGSVVESAPGMLAGMGGTAALAGRIGVKAALATAEGQAAAVAARAAGKTAGQAAAAALETGAGKAAAQQAVDAAGTRLLAAGSGIEGAQSAGQIADQAREAGRSYGDYALPAVAAGLGTAAIGLGAGKLMGDSATNIATGSASTAVKGGLAKRIGKEFLSEGVLEEMPQSAQEQVWTNMANGDPLDKGVGNAAGTGLITGGVMGAGLGGFQNHEGDHAAPAPAPIQLPNTGPLSQAANAGQAAQAAAAAQQAAQQAAAAPATPATPAQLPLDAIEARLAELRAIGQGADGKQIANADGTTTDVPAVMPRPYTEAEKNEYRELVAEQKKRIAIPADQQAEYQRLLAEEYAQKKAQAAQAGQSGLFDAPPAPAPEQQEAEIQRMLAEEAAQRRAAEQHETATTNAIVEHDMLQRAAANRKALRDDVLNDGQIRAGDKKKAFQSALEREGYTFPVLDSDDHAAINAHAAAARAGALEQVLQDHGIPAEGKAAAFSRALADHGFKDVAPTEADLDAIAEATAPVPAAPNQLVDAVPERAAPAPAPAGTNTAAVDAAIASGMRLKAANGSVLHKKGSAKIFKLSAAQKAYYLERMAALEGAQAEAPAAAQQAEPQNIPENIPAPVDPQVQAIDTAAHEAATSPMNDRPEPTQAQKEAGNYKKGHIRLHGLQISIENPAGSVRKGVDPDGTPWETTMANHYGDILGTHGADGDPVDVFVGPNPESEKAFVVDQYDRDGRKFDEHKVMLGFDTIEQARAAYSSNYDPDWKGGKRIVETDIAGLKEWLARGKADGPLAHVAPENSEIHDFHPRKSEAERGAEEVARTLAQMAHSKRSLADRQEAMRSYGEGIAEENPARAEAIALELRTAPEKYAKIAGVSQEEIVGYSGLTERPLEAAGRKEQTFARLIAATEARIADLKRLQSQAGHNAGVYDDKIAKAEAALAQYREADARLRDQSPAQVSQPEQAPAAQVDKADDQKESEVDKPAAGKESPSGRRPMPADYTRNVIHNARQWGFAGADLVPDEMGHISANFQDQEVFTTKSRIAGTTSSPAAMIKVAQAPNGRWTSALSYMGPTSGQSVGLGMLPGYTTREEAIRAQLAKLKGNVKPAVYADMEREVGLAPSKIALNKKTVKDMTDEELLQAQAVMADTPRATKIAKEIASRGLDKQEEVPPAAKPEGKAAETPLSPYPTDEEITAKAKETGVSEDFLRDMRGFWNTDPRGWNLSDAAIKSHYARKEAEGELHRAYGDWTRFEAARHAVEQAVLADPEFSKYNRAYMAGDGPDVTPLNNEIARRLREDAARVTADRESEGSFENLLAKRRSEARMQESERQMTKMFKQEIDATGEELDFYVDQGVVSTEERAELSRKMDEAGDMLELADVMSEAAEKFGDRYDARRKVPAANEPAPAKPAQAEPAEDAKALSTAPEHARMDGNGPTSQQFTSPEFRAAADRVKELQKQRDEILAEHGEYFTGKGSSRKPTKEAPPEVVARWKEFKREWDKASTAYNAALTVPKYGTATGNPVEDTAPVDESIVPMTMDKAAFEKITDEWADLFAEPAADERVRLDLKNLPEVLEPDAAAAQVEQWKEHARRQGETHRSENSRRTVLSLFDLSGEWSKPWVEAGYNVVQFDIQTGQDVFDFNVEYFTENYDLSDVYCILAATPCTDFASSGARHFLAKDEAGQTEQSVELVNQTARTIEYFRPAVWALENPVGRLSNVTGLPSPRLMFQPHAFGDPYTKETWIWGRFNPDLPTANVFPVEGSKMHSKYGGKSIETKNARSETPEGFAYAFFMANNYVDMPVEKKLAVEYPEASGAIAEALKAGVTEPEIHELMDRTYGDYDYEAARNVLIQAVADRQGASAKKDNTSTERETAASARVDEPAEAAPPAQAQASEDVDDGKDIPLAFYKKVKVPHDVWIEDERRYESVEIPADKALASVREDIDNLKSLLGCMKG